MNLEKNFKNETREEINSGVSEFENKNTAIEDKTEGMLNFLNENHYVVHIMNFDENGYLTSSEDVIFSINEREEADALAKEKSAHLWEVLPLERQGTSFKSDYDEHLKYPDSGVLTLQLYPNYVADEALADYSKNRQ